MYKAIIVDDESIIRNGIKRHFDWQSHGIEIIADFSDGQKACNYIENNLIDLIVTDVRMPYIDGIELSKKATLLNPAVKIIFISGHAEVNYLKDALKMDAVDYILKPINNNELSAAVTRVVNIMDRERNRQAEIKKMEARLAQSIPFLQERFLMMLLKEDTSNIEKSMERISFLDIPLNNDDLYCVIVFKVRNLWKKLCNLSEKQRLMFSLQIKDACTEILKKYGSSIFFENEQDEYVAIYNTRENDFETELLLLVEEIQCEFEKEYELMVSIGISELFSGIDQIMNAYNDAVDSIKNCYLLNENSNISVKKYGGTDDTKSIFEWAKNTVYESIKSGDVEQVKRHASQVFASASTLKSVDDQQNYLTFLLMLPFNLLADLKNKENNFHINIREVLESFLCCSNPREQEKFILQLYEKVLYLISSKSETRSSLLIKHVKSIIREKFMEQISIASIAESVNLTPTYLCVLFKKETGETINDYITRTRLEHAKKLLCDPTVKSYDVCFKVGYLSPSYFSNLFKKYTGMTPGEFCAVKN
jgi:two-component system response regulator YesN